jgi:hypothetical protein
MSKISHFSKIFYYILKEIEFFIHLDFNYNLVSFFELKYFPVENCLKNLSPFHAKSFLGYNSMT